MILALYILGTITYLLIGAALARYINVQPKFAEFKDKPGYIGFVALIWPIVVVLSITLIAVPDVVTWFGRFILGTRPSS